MVGFARLSHPNYKPTMGGRCIETPIPAEFISGRNRSPHFNFKNIWMHLAVNIHEQDVGNIDVIFLQSYQRNNPPDGSAILPDGHKLGTLSRTINLRN